MTKVVKINLLNSLWTVKYFQVIYVEYCVIDIIAILCYFPLIIFCDNFHIVLLAWDGKLSLETKKACGVANEIDMKLTTLSLVK